MKSEQPQKTGLFDFIYRQFSGFAKAGQQIQWAKTPEEKRASRVLGVILALILAVLLFVVFFFDFVPGRLMFRAVIVVIPAIGYIGMLMRGISTRWMWHGIKKYWLPFCLLLFIWVVLVVMVLSIFEVTSEGLIGIFGGIMLISMGFIMAVAYQMHARKIMQESQEGFAGLSLGKKINWGGSVLFSLVWIAFFIGGWVMIGWGTGVLDWFFQEVLGW